MTDELEQSVAEALRDVRWAVDNDGLDYAFRSYSSFKHIKDPKFHELREAYVKAANELEDYVNEHAAPFEEDESEDEEDDD